MSEKSLPSPRSLLSVTAFSMFFLAVSSFFLYSANYPYIPSASLKPVPDGGDDLLDSVVTSLPGEKEGLLEPHGNLDSNQNMYAPLVYTQKQHCDPSNAFLRIYMYDLPPKFHFELLDWKPEHNETWPDVSDPNRVPHHPGGLNIQHSVEYWLTLDLLSSNFKGAIRPCTVIRVVNSSEADFIFVPFFASLSYNRHNKVQRSQKFSLNEKLQRELVEFLLSRPEWKKSGGKDHIFVQHHPNSMLYGRRKLGSASFVLADFGRYEAKMANIEKDVIAPYKHVVRSISSERSAPFERRPTLVYFQGAIYRKDGGSIRQDLYYLLKDKKDVHFTFGSVQRSGIHQAGRGMGSSKFCLNIAGDTPSSNRLFDAIVSHCVPVIISDEIELPYEDVLDYSEFCIFVWASDAVKPGFLLNLLRGIERDEWTKMWRRLKEVVHHFEYQYPSQPGDAVDMIWKVFARKRSGLKMTRRERTYRTPELLMKGR